MGIFSDIYNTVAKFFRPQEEAGEEASKSVATNRLKLVLMQDRTNLTPRILEQMRSELIELLSRYVELDKELLELNFEQEGDQVALMLSIPVIRAKDEEEIEAGIQAHKEAIAEELNSENADNKENGESEENIEDNEISEDAEEAEDGQNEENDSEIVDADENSEEKGSIKSRKKKKKESVSTPEEMSNSASGTEEEFKEQTEEV